MRLIPKSETYRYGFLLAPALSDRFRLLDHHEGDVSDDEELVAEPLFSVLYLFHQCVFPEPQAPETDTTDGTGLPSALCRLSQ